MVAGAAAYKTSSPVLTISGNGASFRPKRSPLLPFEVPTFSYLLSYRRGQRL